MFSKHKVRRQKSSTTQIERKAKNNKYLGKFLIIVVYPTYLILCLLLKNYEVVKEMNGTLVSFRRGDFVIEHVMFKILYYVSLTFWKSRPSPFLEPKDVKIDKWSHLQDFKNLTTLNVTCIYPISHIMEWTSGNLKCSHLVR